MTHLRVRLEHQNFVTEEKHPYYNIVTQSVILVILFFAGIFGRVLFYCFILKEGCSFFSGLVTSSRSPELVSLRISQRW